MLVHHQIAETDAREVPALPGGADHATPPTGTGQSRIERKLKVRQLEVGEFLRVHCKILV